MIRWRQQWRGNKFKQSGKNLRYHLRSSGTNRAIARGDVMGNRLNLAYSFPLVIGLVMLGLRAPTAGSPGHSAGQQGLANAGVDVLTYHYDIGRQGQNTLETVLTPSNVNFNSFGKINFFSTDGKVDAQPLYVYQLPSRDRRAEHSVCGYRARQRLRLRC